MQFWEIAIAFRNCRADTPKSFKEHLLESSSYIPEESPYTMSGAFDYILSDVERLVDKAIINILSADTLLRSPQPSWGYVTAYYGNFFLFQALNRLNLDFFTFAGTMFHCKTENYSRQEIILSHSNSSDNHQREYELARCIFNSYKRSKSIDRLWSLGSSPFKHGDEVRLRNNINYEISSEHFYELRADQSIIKSLKKEASNNPFESHNRVADNYQYARESLKYAVSRLRIVCFSLNYVANQNIEYRSYFIRNMNRRHEKLRQSYPDASPWIQQNFANILCFEEIVNEEAIL